MAKRGRTRRLDKDYLNNNKVMKGIIIPCLLVFICSAIFLIWHINGQNSTATGIDYIKGFMSSSGKLNDYQNKIAMKNPAEDIKWYMTEKEIRIEFGRVILTWEPEDFITSENLEHLRQIGFEITYNKNSKTIKLYYNGEEIERWVK